MMLGDGSHTYQQFVAVVLENTQNVETDGGGGMCIK